MENRIWIDQQTDKYFVWMDDELNCHECKREFNEMETTLVVEKYDKVRGNQVYFLCKNCIPTLKFTHDQEQRKL